VLGNRFYQAFIKSLRPVFYTILQNKIFIIGVMHAKRNTEFITNRLNEGLK